MRNVSYSQLRRPLRQNEKQLSYCYEYKYFSQRDSYIGSKTIISTQFRNITFNRYNQSLLLNGEGLARSCIQYNKKKEKATHTKKEKGHKF